MKNKLIEFYLDFVNHYLTISTFCEANGIDRNTCLELLDIGKRYHEEQVKSISNKNN